MPLNSNLIGEVPPAVEFEKQQHIWTNKAVNQQELIYEVSKYLV